MESTGMLSGKKKNDPSAIGIPRREKTSGKGDFSKVRKSLAWNKAFFTEEGVLDSMELSALNGSVSIPDEKFRSNTSRLQPIRETPGRESQTRRRNLDWSPNGLFSDSNSVARGRPPIHRKQENAPEGKNPCRDILRTPISNSQKRTANVSVSTTTSKIPKLKGGNLSVPKPLKNSPQSSKTSKIGQIIPIINEHRNKQSTGVRSTRLSENRKPSSSIQSIPNKSAKIKAGQTPLNNILQARTNRDLTLHPKPPRPGNLTPSSVTIPNHKLITSSSVIEDNNRQALPVKSFVKPTALRKPSQSLGFFQGRKTSLDVVEKVRTTQDTVSGKTLGYTKEIITADTNSSSSTKLSMNCSIKSGTESRLLKRTMVHNSSLAKNSKIRKENSDKLLVAEYINEHDKEKNFGLLESIESEKIGNKLHQQHILKPKSSLESNISEEEKCSVEQIVSFSQAGCEKMTVDVEHCQTNDSNHNTAVNEVSVSSSGNESNQEVFIGNDYSDDRTNKLVQGLSLSKSIINIKNIDSVKNEYTEPVHLNDVQLRSSLSKIQRCSIERINSLGQENIEEHTAKAKYCQPNNDILVNMISGSSEGIDPNYGLISEFKENVYPEKDGFFAFNLDVNALANANAIISESEEQQDSGLICKQKCNIFVSKEEKVDLATSLSDASSILSSNEDLAYCQGEHELKKNAFAADKILVTKNNISKSKCTALECHINPEPFTDEWIAAREAFGEDILTKKGGAVQNSPTEKILSEPSPWSPVKRKNQDVGPYDCTKYTKYLASRHGAQEHSSDGIEM